MSDQEFTQRHNQVIRGLCFGLGFILAVLIMQNCNKPTTRTKTIYGTLHDTVKVTYTKIVPKDKTALKYVPYDVVKTDTITLAGQTIYIEPIDTLKTEAFSKPMEDKNVKITASGILTGKINDIKFDYEIKPVEIKQPSRWGIGIGAGVDINGNPNITAGLNYQLIRF
jgi:opacity protein-like surface antigen